MKRVLLTEEFGLYRLHLDRGDVGGRMLSGPSIESVLGKAMPDAPSEMVHSAGEVLQALLDKFEGSQGQIHEGVLGA